MLHTGWLVKKQSKTKVGFKNMEEHARRERQEVKRETEKKEVYERRHTKRDRRGKGKGGIYVYVCAYVCVLLCFTIWLCVL
jgi:hypothetical protein